MGTPQRGRPTAFSLLDSTFYGVHIIDGKPQDAGAKIMATIRICAFGYNRSAVVARCHPLHLTRLSLRPDYAGRSRPGVDIEMQRMDCSRRGSITGTRVAMNFILRRAQDLSEHVALFRHG